MKKYICFISFVLLNLAAVASSISSCKVPAFVVSQKSDLSVKASYVLKEKRSLKMASSWTTTNEEDIVRAREELNIWPLDKYNAKLLNEVHPKDWPADDKAINGKDENDQLSVDEYDLVVIGAGAGGLVSSRQVRKS